MMKRILFLIVLILALLWAVKALFGVHYIPTHDGEYHIIRIIEFSRMLQSGYWFPRWAPTLNSGYGVPVFEFNYPLPNYIGAGVRVLTHDAVRAFQMSEGLGYIVAAMALFGWLYCLFGLTPAAIGTMVGMFVPYWFVDMYVRGSIGEIWATSFLFAVLFFLEKRKYAYMALAYALLIFSHNILAMVYTPFIFLYVILRDKRALWSIAGGLGLSACFWLPALLEQKYVVGLNTINFRQHFVQLYELLIPSWGTEFSATGSIGNKTSFQIGIVPIVTFVLALAAFHKNKDKRMKRLFTYFFIVLCLSIMLMFSFSLPIWQLLSPLQLIQYPWRLLSFVIPVSAFASAFWVSQIKRKWLGILLAVAAIAVTSTYFHPVLYTPRNEAYYLSRPNFTDGTSSMGNSFSTIWTGWKDTRPGSPIEVQNGNLGNILTQRYLDKKFTVHLSSDGEVTVNTLYFPGWKAYIEGEEVPIDYKADGIIHLAVPAGDHTIQIALTETWPQKLGDCLSIASLVVLLTWGILRGRRKARV